MKKGIYLAYLFALTNALIVGLSFLFTKTAVNDSNPIDTLFYRCVFYGDFINPI